MSKAWSAFTTAIIMALLFGTEFKIGFNPEPDVLANTVVTSTIGKIVNYLNIPQATFLWSLISYLLFLLGIVSLILEVFFILSSGIFGAIASVLGFAGVMLPMLGYSIVIGALMIFAGVMLVSFAGNERPKEKRK